MRHVLVIALAAALGATVAAQSMVKLPVPLDIYVTGVFTNEGGGSIDAANEYRGVVGQLFLKDGPGTKTCSAAGGCHIWWDAQNTATFANAGTTLRIGIQDVDASGFGDGTFDVSADLVGGTDTISQGTVDTPMESNFKTMSYGDIIAIQATMISRGGSDAVVPDAFSRLPSVYAVLGFPYGVFSAGTPTKSSFIYFKAMIQFDDSSYGWINAAPNLAFTQVVATLLTFGTGTTPDEYALVGSLPFDCGCSGFSWFVENIAAGDDFEYILYTDPLGTPAAVSGGTITMDPDLAITTVASGYLTGRFSANKLLTAGTLYGFAIRPTTANTISIVHENTTSGAEAANKSGQLFNSVGLYSRSDQTGAFASVTAQAIPRVIVHCAELIQ